MNSTTHTLSIDPRGGVVRTSPTTGGVSAWAAKLGWSVWYGLQSYGARRALREIRLLGIGVGQNAALPVDGQNTVGQTTTRRQEAT